MPANPTDGLLKISEFARIAEISRKGLIFYDNIGVFSPAYTAPNGYRYYSHEQIYLISVITLLRELDTPLDQIRDFLQQCTPQHATTLLRQQGDKLQQKIQMLQGIQDMLAVRLQKLEDGMARETGTVRLVERGQTPLFVSDAFQAPRDQVPDDVWIGFYLKCKQHGVAFGYPEGFLVSQDHLCAQTADTVSHIVCHVGAAYANFQMPAGRYLIACGPGSFADAGPIYCALLDYAQEHALTIAGPGYETRLIDETASPDRAVQRIEVHIPVA